MSKIISPRKYTDVVSYTLNFKRIGSGRYFSGLAFDCDANGAVDESALNLDALANLALGRRGEGYEPPYVERHEREHIEVARLECDCGEIVFLSGFTNTCECDADYNMSGQRLAGREQWGEETGETADEILNDDNYGFYDRYMND